MDSDDWLGLGLFLVCLALIIMVAVAEVALTSVRRERAKELARQGTGGAEALEWLLQRPDLLSPALNMIKGLAIIGSSCLIVVLGARLFSLSGGIIAASIAILLALLLFLWAVSKAMANRKPERAALMIANPVRALSLVLIPVLRLFTRSPHSVDNRKTNSDEEATLADDAFDIITEVGAIEAEQKEMIRGILDLGETAAREIMVPRVDIVAAESDADISSVVDLIVKEGHSRIPLYEGTVDNIVGIVYAKDLLRLLRDGTVSITAKEVARPAHFIPESKRVDELLQEFQERRLRMAIVIDEYGGTSGLVTINDILEEIVGEISDEYDKEGPEIERLSPSEAIMDAKVSIGDLNELFGLDIKEDGFDTVGGFLLSQVGRIPSVGDEIEAAGIRISVLSTIGRRLKKVKIVREQ